MNPTPPYDDILEDETLAPLKRNHACLQCKKRKVKCDATKPTCSPCLRSHAHAVRSANRNGTAPPTLTCTYTEGDSPEPSPSTEGKTKKKKSTGDSSVTTNHVGVKRQHTAQGTRDSPDQEKENLKARIAELEARLAVLTPPSSHSGIEPSLPISSTMYSNNMPFSSTFPTANSAQNVEPILEEIGSGVNSTFNIGLDNANNVPLPDSLGDFSGLDDFFLVPLDWPKGLPLPFLLEHLIETFFNYVPQTPRMLHRSTLLARIKLPPSSPDFPFPGLLHAICASASTYTAWVNNLAPHLLEETVQRHLAMGLDLTTIEDFGLSQAHLGSKCVDMTTSVCIMGSGPLIFQLTQACILLGDVFFQKGFPMKGWMMGGHPARLLAVLELNTRQSKPKGFKKPLLNPPESDVEREERLITTWMAFVIDSGFTINSNWLPSMTLTEIRCKLPTSAEDWAKISGMAKNPQDATSHDLYYSHPIEDSFIFVIKGNTLIAEVTQWIRQWQQRENPSEDKFGGTESEKFKTLNNSIQAFSTSLPAALKNIFRYLDTRSMPFDANLLTIHLIPNIATCLLHEPFMQWLPYDPSTIAVKQAYESIMAVLHLIPSNLDITLILTPFLAMSLYTVGRFILDFIKNAESTGQDQTAARYQADLMTMIGILHRYGQRHPLGNAMVHFLEQYTKTSKSGLDPDPSEKCDFNTKRIEYLDAEFSTNNNSINIDNEETLEVQYLNKVKMHAGIAQKYPNFLIANSNGIYKYNKNNNDSTDLNQNISENTSRSNSISGISPNTNTTNSNLSNSHTPESLNNFNFINNKDNMSKSDGFMSEYEIGSIIGNASGSGNGYISGKQTQNTLNSIPPQQQQQQQQMPNNTGMTPNPFSSSSWVSQSTSNSNPNSNSASPFDDWVKANNSTEPGRQMPLINFLGNFGTEDMVNPIPLPNNNQAVDHSFEDPAWKVNSYDMLGVKPDVINNRQ